MLGQLLFGHLLGDYFLQTSWMAKNKSKKSREGWFAAIVHSLIYTASICLLTFNFAWPWVLCVFLSHVFIDHYSTATWYLSKIKGMNKPWEADESYAPLYWIVYVVVDNGMHLFLMYGSYLLLSQYGAF